MVIIINFHVSETELLAGPDLSMGEVYSFVKLFVLQVPYLYYGY